MSFLEFKIRREENNVKAINYSPQYLAFSQCTSKCNSVIWAWEIQQSMQIFMTQCNVQNVQTHRKKVCKVGSAPLKHEDIDRNGIWEKRRIF